MNEIKRACGVVGGPTELARRIRVSAPTVIEWGNGKRPVPVARCAAIEKACGGAVTRRDLRPADWHEIWPELVAVYGEPSPFIQPEGV